MLFVTPCNYFNNRRMPILLFFKKFCLKETFPEIWNKMYLRIWKFKVAPIYLPRGVGKLSNFTSTDSFLKSNEYIYFYFSIQCIFLTIFDRLNLFCYTWYTHWSQRHLWFSERGILCRGSLASSPCCSRWQRTVELDNKAPVAVLQRCAKTW